MRWKRWLGIGLAAVAVVLLVAYGFRPQPVLVETAVVKRGPLRVTVDEEGKTRVIDRFVVSAPVAGYARRVTLEVGDPVKQGQILCSLEPLRPTVLDPRSRAEAEARVEAAEATLRGKQEKAKAAAVDASFWQGELARVQKLYKTGDVAEDRYDRTVNSQRQADAAVRSAQHDIEEARSELEAARAALEYSAAVPDNTAGETVPVRAPVGGRVLKIVHESEGVVNAGDPILELADAHSLEIEVEVLSADAVRISPGSRVLFERWGGGEDLEGRVRRIEPAAFTKVSALGVEEQRVRVIADITSPPEEWRRLGDKYRVEASFILWEGQKVLQVPASALFRYQNQWAVFTVENGSAHRRKVEIGRQNGLVTQIVSGLREGDTVITHPDESIEDGRRVTGRS